MIRTHRCQKDEVGVILVIVELDKEVCVPRSDLVWRDRDQVARHIGRAGEHLSAIGQGGESALGVLWGCQDVERATGARHARA